MSIEDGSGLSSVLEVMEGLQFDRGFLSPYVINTPVRQAAVLEDVAILLCNDRLSSLNDLMSLLVINTLRGMVACQAPAAVDEGRQPGRNLGHPEPGGRR